MRGALGQGRELRRRPGAPAPPATAGRAWSRTRGARRQCRRAPARRGGASGRRCVGTGHADRVGSPSAGHGRAARGRGRGGGRGAAPRAGAGWRRAAPPAPGRARRRRRRTRRATRRGRLRGCRRNGARVSQMPSIARLGRMRLELQRRAAISIAWSAACAAAAPAGGPPAWPGSSRPRRFGRLATHCAAARASASGSTPGCWQKRRSSIGQQQVEELAGRRRPRVVRKRQTPPGAGSRASVRPLRSSDLGAGLVRGARGRAGRARSRAAQTAAGGERLRAASKTLPRPSPRGERGEPSPAGGGSGE